MKGGEYTPMYLVGGSLGSGKTTLLQHLLQQELGRVAIVVNEFGEIGIDGQVLEGKNVRLIELSGGCVCCSLAGEFEAAIAELIATVNPDRILVETTGVAEADALVLDIEERLPLVRLETVIVVVDADVCRRFSRWGYVERTQIETADILLINKTDLVGREDLEEVRKRLRECREGAILIETSFARLDPGLIAVKPAAERRTAAIGTLHDHAYSTFTWESDLELERTGFEEAVASWPEEVYRAKGFVRLEDGLWLFNYVAGRWQLDPVGEGRPGVVWIGPGIEGLAAAIVARLEACAISREL